MEGGAVLGKLREPKGVGNLGLHTPLEALGFGLRAVGRRVSGLGLRLGLFRVEGLVKFGLPGVRTQIVTDSQLVVTGISPPFPDPLNPEKLNRPSPPNPHPNSLNP